MTAESLQSRSRFVTAPWVAALLIIALYYTWFRYPFMINSTTTSPTYSDTPLWLILGKYVLVVLATVPIAIVALRSARSGMTRAGHVFGVMLGVLAAVLLIKGAIVRADNLLEFGIFTASALAVYVYTARQGFDERRIGRVLWIFAAIAVLVDVVQGLLFATIGRLPALAYPNSISVRFGSLWDDPNSYAFVIALLVPVVALARSARWVKVLLLVGLGVGLVATQSLTGIASTGIAFLVTAIVFARRSRRLLLAIGIAVLLVVIAVTALVSTPLFSQFWITKVGSAIAHLDAIAFIQHLTITDYLGLRSTPVFAEAGYVSLLANAGLLVTLLFLALLVTAIVLAYRAIRSTPLSSASGVLVGIFAFLISVGLGNVNLPLFETFPINLLALLCMAFIVARHFRPTPDLAQG